MVKVEELAQGWVKVVLGVMLPLEVRLLPATRLAGTRLAGMLHQQPALAPLITQV